MNFNELTKKSKYANKEILDITNNSFESNRDLKTFDKLILFDGRSLNNVSLYGRGDLSLSNKQSRDNSFILCLNTNTNIDNQIPRPSSSIKFQFDHLDLSSYNYFGVSIYVESSGYEGFYFHFMTGNNDDLHNHAPIIIPNKWNFVTWDASHIKRDNVNIFTITPFLMGCPPEGIDNIKVYINYIYTYKKEPIYNNGWDLDKRIAFSHSGYLVDYQKKALITQTDIEFFKIVNEKKEEKTFKVKNFDHELGSYSLLDFSSIKQEGIYHLEIGNFLSKSFYIGNNCYYPAILKSLNFLRMLRCGEHIPGVHSKCHLNSRTIHPNGSFVPNFGGWHDAGDVSQFEICTAEIATSLLDLQYTITDEEFKNRILEEAKVGIDWLLQTRFGDGYRALAVSYSIWRSNVGTYDNKSLNISVAEEGAFENILSAISLAKAAYTFNYIEPIYGDWCKRIAIEDFNLGINEYRNNIYTKRWGPTIESQTGGAIIICACELFKLTNNQEYLNIAEEFSQIVMNCQEDSKNFPLPGFFYEDQKHEYVLSYEHRGHEEYPISGLASLYMLTQNESLKKKLKKALDLYKDFVIKSVDYTPYGVLPGGIYNINKINLSRFTIVSGKKDEAYASLCNQIKNGIKITDDWFLRIFPIAYTRRGFHATLLSKTKGVSILAKALNNKVLKQIAINQLEWILGYNPFASSSMYGEGYNYHNLYVAFSREIVGSLPVGFMTKESIDAPYWPDYNNAVFKEIWGHTTSKFLGILGDIL